MPEPINLDKPVRRVAAWERARNLEPSGAFTNGLRGKLNRSFDGKNEKLFSDLLNRLENAENGNGD